MRSSFAYFTYTLQACLAACLLALAGCATLPPPTAELAAAQQAVSRADAADADQHAAEALGQARQLLARAQAAMAAGNETDARSLALSAAADADLAHARSREAAANAEVIQRRREIAELRQRLQMEDTP